MNTLKDFLNSCLNSSQGLGGFGAV